MWEVVNNFVDELLSKRFHGAWAGGGRARVLLSEEPRRSFLMTDVMWHKQSNRHPAGGHATDDYRYKL